LIRRLLPDVMMKGAKWTIDTVIGRDEVVAAGGRVALIDLVEGHSTSHVLGRLRAPAAPAKADA
jgi:D-beta-D-heptose 7-phosphate kinase/D-beta-D-heptose 1-phosphate adenosyltransferase